MPTLSFTYNATQNVITTYLFLFHVFLEQKQSKDSKTSRTKPIKKQQKLIIVNNYYCIFPFLNIKGKKLNQNDQNLFSSLAGTFTL